MRFKYLIVLLFSCCLSAGFSQSPDWDKRMAFAEQVRRIRYWAYIEGDSAYRCYTEALDAIEDALNRKGYATLRDVYFPGSQISPAEWKEKRIHSLPPGEAFLEIRLSMKSDTGKSQASSTVMVQDASGRVYAQHTLKPDEVQTLEVVSSSTASLFARLSGPDSARAGLFYSKTSSVSNANIGNAAMNSIRGIPSSKNPVPRNKTATSAKKNSIMFQMVFYGGYCAAGSIDVTGGKTTFVAGPDYGLEVDVNVYKGFDFSIGYKREDTFAVTESPDYPKEGELALSNNYILLGCTYNFLRTKKLQPYAGLDFGSVGIYFKDPFFSDVWYFAVGARAGLCWYISRVVGFRLQSQLLFQVHPSGAPFLYSGDLYTMPKPVNANSSLPQPDITAGLLIRLGK